MIVKNKHAPETKMFRAGYAGLLGWTNVGKSTLVNHLTGMKIAITADSPQTTRNRLLGIVQTDNFQIALADTPGIHSPQNELSRKMLKTTWGTMATMDVVVWMVFPHKSATLQLNEFGKRLEKLDLPVIIAINKMDTVLPESTFPLADALCKEVNPVEVIPISAKTGMNTDVLVQSIASFLPVCEPIYPVDEVTDQPERIIAAEYIREQVIEKTFQELPHVVAIEIERFKENTNGVLEIQASIVVEKKSQKGIVIGNRGTMIKTIGIAARHNISALLCKPVDLRLWIRVKPKWRNDANKLKELGFSF
jgi:GTPase